MVQLVEELRERLNTIADGEQKLVSSLREALNRFDQKLLQDVRSITPEHESRRGAILNELQGLASRMGAFPPPRDVRLGPNEPTGCPPPCHRMGGCGPSKAGLGAKRPTSCKPSSIRISRSGLNSIFRRWVLAYRRHEQIVSQDGPRRFERTAQLELFPGVELGRRPR